MITLLISCDPSNPASQDAGVQVDGAAPTADAATVLASGTTANEVNVTCPAHVPTGAECKQLTVTCPGVEDIDVTVAVSTPPGGSGTTVVLHAGGGGTHFFNEGGIADLLVSQGIRTVQVQWTTGWEISSMAQSALTAACRPATIFRWAFENAHSGSHAAGFCALGQSGGSGAVAYSLAHYGLGDTLDFAMMTAGPPFGRIDYGCAPDSYAGPPIDMCTGEPTPIMGAPLAYGSIAAPFLDSIEGTTTCGTGTATPSQLAHWAADSVASPGAVYAYPQTETSFWYCNRPNETAGLGWFYNSQVASTKDVHCISACSGEVLYSDPPTVAAIGQRMLDGCKPHH